MKTQSHKYKNNNNKKYIAYIYMLFKLFLSNYVLCLIIIVIYTARQKARYYSVFALWAWFPEGEFKEWSDFESQTLDSTHSFEHDINLHHIFWLGNQKMNRLSKNLEEKTCPSLYKSSVMKTSHSVVHHLPVSSTDVNGCYWMTEEPSRRTEKNTLENTRLEL